MEAEHLQMTASMLLLVYESPKISTWVAIKPHLLESGMCSSLFTEMGLRHIDVHNYYMPDTVYSYFIVIRRGEFKKQKALGFFFLAYARHV